MPDTQPKTKGEVVFEGLRAENDRLRSCAEQLLEVVMLDSAALTYGLKRRRAIEAAGNAGITVGGSDGPI